MEPNEPKKKRGAETVERPEADGSATPRARTYDAPIMKPYDTAKLDARVRVNKAYKMFVNGAFVRSESGRYFQVQSSPEHEDADPDTTNVPRGSRKDVRDAVLHAKNAWGGWEKRTAYNRGQILYRLAEVMESRRPELTQSLERSGESAASAAADSMSGIHSTSCSPE